MSDVFKSLRNQVLGTTGCKVNDEAISIILAWQASRQSGDSDPAAWQFYQHGKWHTGMDENNHRENTEKAGFPTRDLYPSQPPARVPDDVMARIKNLLCALSHQGEQLDAGEPPYDVGDWGVREAQDLHALLTHQPSEAEKQAAITDFYKDNRRSGHNQSSAERVGHQVSELLDRIDSYCDSKRRVAKNVALPWIKAQTEAIRELLKQEGGE